MTRHQNKTSGPDKGQMEKEKTGEREAGGGGEDNCRCKEVAKKTPFEMFKLMISDLAFWKKTKS